MDSGKLFAEFLGKLFAQLFALFLSLFSVPCQIYSIVPPDFSLTNMQTSRKFEERRFKKFLSFSLRALMQISGNRKGFRGFQGRFRRRSQNHTGGF